MSIAVGCENARNMITIKEIDCPSCGDCIEVFVKDGHTTGEAVCESCGYMVPENAHLEELFECQRYPGRGHGDY